MLLLLLLVQFSISITNVFCQIDNIFNFDSSFFHNNASSLFFSDHSDFPSLSSNLLSDNTSAYPLSSPVAQENREIAREQFYLGALKINSDEALTCCQFIESRGFICERHFVVTADGYILQLHRIINPYAQAARGKKLKPVLLVHGVILSCSSWLFNSPDGHIQEWINGQPPDVKTNNLGFLLANLAFDVWLANSRGTSYSTNHTRIRHPHLSRRFWNFSFADMAKYDVPAMVNYIREVTGYEKIVYIGYSQGNLQMFLKLAVDPSFSKKLSLFFALEPIAFLGNPAGLVTLIPHGPEFYRPLNLFNGPIPKSLAEFDTFLTVFCTRAIFLPLCEQVLNAVVGPDSPQLNSHRFSVITSSVDSVSLKNLLHYDQTLRFDQVRAYDYGPKINKIKYRSRLPPKYPLQNIPTYNLILMTGKNDYFATIINTLKLRKVLKGKPLVDYEIPYPLWNHADPIFGKDAYEYMNKEIVYLLRKYSDK